MDSHNIQHIAAQEMNLKSNHHSMDYIIIYVLIKIIKLPFNTICDAEISNKLKVSKFALQAKALVLTIYTILFASFYTKIIQTS